MSTIAIPLVDLREEMDVLQVDPVVPPARFKSPSKTSDTKTKFSIRTLPRECNPTPITTGGGVGNNSVASFASPSSRKLTSSCGRDTEFYVEENPFDDLTEEKLQKLSGKQDLSRVTSLQLTIDSGKQSVEILGELLPSLEHLRLENSILHSFRDLGTSLHSLQSFSAINCRIKELDGIHALTGLQELYLQQNEISDISPLSMHEELQTIDLRSNAIADVGQIEQLAMCPQLKSLLLEANPVCRVQFYRQIVANFLPQLVLLDEKPLTSHERVKISEDSIDEAIQTLKEDLEAMEMLALASPRGGMERPMTARQTEDGRGLRVSFEPDVVRKDDYGSTLTHGTDTVFAGNVTSALRRHRSGSEAESSPIKQPGGNKAATSSITATLDRASEMELNSKKSREAIWNELKAWRMETAASQLGVMHMPPHKTAKSKERVRPSTSAGVIRGTIKEAFLETRDKASTAPAAPPTPKRRESGGAVSSSKVDILILEESREPLKTTESPRKIVFDSRDSLSFSSGEWHLDVLSPILEPPTRKNGGISSRMHQEQASEGESSDSDGDETHRHQEREQCKRRSRAKGAFFDVAESLNAIDKWREEMGDDEQEDDKMTRVNPARYHQEYLSPRPVSRGNSSSKATPKKENSRQPSSSAIEEPVTTPVKPSKPPASGATPTKRPSRVVASKTSDETLGPANDESDDRIVQLMKDKHKSVAELKTRDGFRRFFRGITASRLEAILSRVFADADKVQRRMQLMQGYLGEDREKPVSVRRRSMVADAEVIAEAEM